MARIKEVLEYESKYTVDDILINLKGINNQAELEKEERKESTKKLMALYLMGITGNFDAEHYYGIHKYIFEDFYPFAGKVRNENIYKSFSFCLPQYIDSMLKDTLKHAKIDAEKIQNEEDLISFLAYYYSELDVIHPFREGNGRTLREFLRQYVLKINQMIDFGEYEIDYNQIDDRDKFIQAVELADVRGDIDNLKEIFKNCLVNHMEKKHVR